MPTVTANGVRLFYEEAGAADTPPLILIMGWGGDHTAWALQIPALVADHRVIALDKGRVVLDGSVDAFLAAPPFQPARPWRSPDDAELLLVDAPSTAAITTVTK